MRGTGNAMASWGLAATPQNGSARTKFLTKLPEQHCFSLLFTGTQFAFCTVLIKVTIFLHIFCIFVNHMIDIYCLMFTIAA